MGGALSAAPGLADVVCRAERLSQQSLVCKSDGSVARRIAASDRASGGKSLPECSAAIRAGSHLRLLLYKFCRAPSYGRLVATPASGSLFSDRHTAKTVTTR